MAGRVELKKVVEKMDLKNLTPNVDIRDKTIEIPDINRPALQLTGYFEHFDSDRVQLIGYVEYTFLEKLSEETKKEIDTLQAENNSDREELSRLAADYAKGEAVIGQLIDLALLANGMLRGEQLAKFIERSTDLLK